MLFPNYITIMPFHTLSQSCILQLSQCNLSLSQCNLSLSQCILSLSQSNLSLSQCNLPLSECIIPLSQCKFSIQYAFISIIPFYHNTMIWLTSALSQCNLPEDQRLIFYLPATKFRSSLFPCAWKIILTNTFCYLQIVNTFRRQSYSMDYFIRPPGNFREEGSTAKRTVVWFSSCLPKIKRCQPSGKISQASLHS